MTTTDTITPAAAPADSDTAFADPAPQSGPPFASTWWTRAGGWARQRQQELVELLDTHSARQRLMDNRVEDVPLDATTPVKEDAALRGEAVRAARPATAAVLLAALLLAASMTVTAAWGALMQPWAMLEQLVGPVDIDPQRLPGLQALLDWLAPTPLSALLLWLSIYASAATALARVHIAARHGSHAWGWRMALAVGVVAVTIGLYQVLDHQHGAQAAFAGTGLMLAGWRLAARATAHEAGLVHAVNRHYARLRLPRPPRERLR